MDLRIPIGGNQLPDWMKNRKKKEEIAKIKTMCNLLTMI